MSQRTRVLIVDDSEDILDVYRRLIDTQPDLQCVAALESTVGVEDRAVEHRADIAVIDLIGPDRSAIDAIRGMAAQCPECRVIAFSGMDDEATCDQAFEAGAWSLVSKNDHPMRLLEEIRRVVSLPK
jgi:DNA-binding NarL/FixJ family response regulator